jgi:hypothetical protein
MDDMTPAEQAAAFKATWWAQNITNAEWPALLGHEGASKYARSRLKRKVVGWLMAMGRIAALNPKLYNQAVNEALALYEQQLGQPHPMFRSYLDEVADGPQPEEGAEDA